MPAVTCPRCNGRMLKDEDGLACTACGARQYALAPLTISQAQAELKVKVIGHKGGMGRE